MANPELSQLEKIKKTREVVDPLRRGTLIGTSGIALYFDGFEWPVAPAADLDLLVATTPEIIIMRNHLTNHRRIRSANFRRTTNEKGKTVPVYNKVDVVPRNPKSLLPANIFTAVDDSRFYMSPEEIDLHRTIQAGETTLDLQTLLLWKMFALRRKDIQDGTILTAAAIKNELVSPIAANSLRQAIVHLYTLPARDDVDSYSYNGS